MRSVGPRLVLLAALLAALPLASRRHQPTPQTTETSPPEKLASRYDPKTTGTVSGTVLWSDELPHIPPLHVLSPVDGKGTEDFPNPNEPTINPDNGQIEGALVFIRRIDPA